MRFFSTKKPATFTVYDLPKPLPAPDAITQGTAPAIPEDAGVDTSDALSIAIFYHERNHLDIAAYYFSLSAAQGNPLGLFLYAISMRHGWGLPKNESEAVRLLQVAAQKAMGEVSKQAQLLQQRFKRYSVASDAPAVPWSTGSGGGADAGPASTVRNGNRNTLARASKEPSPPAPQLSELMLAIYELAMSFKQGWGLPKNKVTAVYYLNMAAELGDPDAQIELAECYLRGDGIKANKKMAAHWFRKAEKQVAQRLHL
ncbi:hypothetical protein BC831DRAFT_498482 [Entophlyctis helioformis]|nr:hypothetical protein BC831DRAFT_498482 [Entophlyctis helioformis]